MFMASDDSAYDYQLSESFLQNVLTDLSSLDCHYEVDCFRT